MRLREIALASALIVAVCAGVAMAQETPAAAPTQTTDQTAAPAANAAPAADATATPPAADATTSAPDAAAVEEQPGTIVFFRPGRLTGGAWTYTIAETDEGGHVDDTDPRVGRLPNGGFFRATVPAGIHNYNITGPMAVNLAEDRLRIEVEPGETYYVEQTVRMGLLTGGFRLVPSTQAEFESHHMREWTPPANWPPAPPAH